MTSTILTRRAFAAGALAGGMVGGSAVAQTLTATSDLGPFFPASYRGETDADLTRVGGSAGRAQGQVIEVMGRVLNRHGKPIPGAKLDVWQANAAGRYAHPQDPAIMPLDPNFQGFASIRTSDDGRWKMLTVKPGTYDSPIGQRPPHIHLDVVGGDFRGVYQMYFPEDEVLNKGDSLFKGLGDSAPTAIARALGDHRYGWDIVLLDG
jgi:protocatechuate 3,4-dioxygenase, beta subunit